MSSSEILLQGRSRSHGFWIFAGGIGLILLICAAVIGHAAFVGRMVTLPSMTVCDMHRGWRLRCDNAAEASRLAASFDKQAFQTAAREFASRTSAIAAESLDDLQLFAVAHEETVFLYYNHSHCWRQHLTLGGWQSAQEADAETEREWLVAERAMQSALKDYVLSTPAIRQHEPLFNFKPGSIPGWAQIPWR